MLSNAFCKKKYINVTNVSSYNKRGFSLIELMIVVAVVGILSTIAYPSYQNHIRKSRRVDAKNALLDYASRQERYFAITTKYATDLKDLGYGEKATVPLDINSSGNVFYKLNILKDKVTRNTFEAIATPVGAQVSDTNCYTYQINEKGERKNLNASGTEITGKDCW